MFYLIAYGAAVLGAFGVVMLISGGIREQTGFDRFRGLGRRQPVLAVLLTVFLLSLAGIPPTAGFAAKVLVFGAATTAGYWPLVLIGALASVAGAFFYLRVVALMAMREPGGRGHRRSRAAAEARARRARRGGRGAGYRAGRDRAVAAGSRGAHVVIDSEEDDR